MMPYINRYLYSDRVPGDWQLQRVIEYARTNPEQSNATLIEAVNKDRKKIMDEWIEYLYTVNEEYKMDPFFRFFVMSAILDDLKDGEPSVPPTLDAAALSMVYSDIDKHPEHQSFSKLYSKFGIVIATDRAKNSGNNFEMASGGTWIKVPRTYKSDPMWKINYEQVRLISHSKWCTAGTAAESYLPRGDFWVFHEHGGAKLAIRFEGDNVGEIQGPQNNGVIPASHADKVEELVLSKGINLNDQQTLQLAIVLEQGDEGSLNYEGIKFNFDDCIKMNAKGTTYLQNYVEGKVNSSNEKNYANHYHVQNMGSNKVKAMAEGYIVVSGMSSGRGKPPRIYIHPDNTSFTIIQNMNKNLFYLSKCDHRVIMMLALLGNQDAIDLLRDSLRENRNRYHTFEEAIIAHVNISDKLTDILDNTDLNELIIPKYIVSKPSRIPKSKYIYGATPTPMVYQVKGLDDNMEIHYDEEFSRSNWDRLDIKIDGLIAGYLAIRWDDVYFNNPNISTDKKRNLLKFVKQIHIELKDIEFSDYDINTYRIGDDYQSHYFEKIYRVPWKGKWGGFRVDGSPVKEYDWSDRYKHFNILHKQMDTIKQRVPKVTEVDPFIPKPLPTAKDIKRMSLGLEKVTKRYKTLLEV
jgi:hypothetical protein